MANIEITRMRELLDMVEEEHVSQLAALESELAALRKGSGAISFVQEREVLENDRSSPLKSHCSEYDCPVVASYSTFQNQVIMDDLALFKGWSYSAIAYEAFAYEKTATLAPSWIIDMKVRIAYRLIKHPSFDLFAIVCICLNTLLGGFSANWNAEHASDEEEEPLNLRIAALVFSIIFLLELLIRILGSGLRFFDFKNGWNMFDIIVVSVDIISMENLDGSKVSVTRLLRLLKFARAARVLKLFHLFAPLRSFLKTLSVCAKPFFWIAFVMFVDVYLISLYMLFVITSHVKEGRSIDPDLQESFDSLGSAFFTILHVSYAGTELRWLALKLKDVSAIHAAVFTLHYVFCAVVVTNIITGMFVESVAHSMANDRDEVLAAIMESRSSNVQKLKECFEEADSDGNGYVTLDEFSNHLSKQKIRAFLESLDFKVYEAHGLFRLLDKHNVGKITIKDFIYGVMRLKGNARNIDLAELWLENKQIFLAVKSLQEDFNTAIDQGVRFRVGRKTNMAAPSSSSCSL